MSISSFKQLIAWQKGHKLVIDVYRCTKTFPKEEIFVLTSQLRRCAISITSNIAEGFSRKSIKEKEQFYSIALGSLTELQNQILIAFDIEYIDKKTYLLLEEQSEEVRRIINGLIKSSSARG